jgi:hypothetical protein
MMAKISKRTRQPDKTASSKSVRTTIVVSTIIIITILIFSVLYLVPNKNILKDPGFEKASTAWVYLHWSPVWESYTISEAHSNSGQKSAHLSLRGNEFSQDSKIVGCVQDIFPQQMPEKVSGHYFVENWTKGATNQYIQCVVMAWDVPGYVDAPLQIRYIIAGIDTEPFYLDNAEYIFISRHQPTENQWFGFERDLHYDFLKAWGFIPEGFSMIRFVFEVRYDGVPYSECSADVYLDDVFMGN